MTKLKCILLLLILSLVFSCKTTEEPAEETNTEETVEVTEEPVDVEQSETNETNNQSTDALDDELLKNAKNQIFQAEEARAATYFPGRLKDLKNLLKEVYNVKDSDPDRARELLKQIETEASDLTRDSWEALKLACIKILEDKTSRLLKIKADKYNPTEYTTSQDQKNLTISTFEAKEYTEALANYRVAYTSLTNILDTLATNLAHIKDLNRMLMKYKAEGESLDTEKWAPGEFQLAMDSYKVASNLIYNEYKAVEGEAALRETLFLARKAIKQTKINIAVSETDSEIFSLMDELEKASTLTVLDEEDNIIEPVEWEGEATLIENPIEAEVEKSDESGLEEIDLEKDVEVDFPNVSYSTIIPGETRVLGEKASRASLLEEAKRLWALGIEARNNGELEVAQEYLAKSKVYVDEYKSLAVDYIYTVILNPERRDCLWRIAEKEEYYNDPFKWQLIWERNKKLIQDPDLIYPGWKLIIPPLD